jgi:hypothetical protein
MTMAENCQKTQSFKNGLSGQFFVRALKKLLAKKKIAIEQHFYL